MLGRFLEKPTTVGSGEFARDTFELHLNPAQGLTSSHSSIHDLISVSRSSDALHNHAAAITMSAPNAGDYS